MSERLKRVLSAVERAADSFAASATKSSEVAKERHELMLALMNSSAELLRLEIRDREEPARPTVVKEMTFGNIYFVSDWHHMRDCAHAARLQKHEVLYIDAEHIETDYHKLRGLNPETMKFTVFARRAKDPAKMAFLSREAAIMRFKTYDAELVFK